MAILSEAAFIAAAQIANIVGITDVVLGGDRALEGRAKPLRASACQWCGRSDYPDIRNNCNGCGAPKGAATPWPSPDAVLPCYELKPVEMYVLKTVWGPALFADAAQLGLTVGAPPIFGGAALYEVRCPRSWRRPPPDWMRFAKITPDRVRQARAELGITR